MIDIMRCVVSGGVTQALKELRYMANGNAVIDFNIGSNSYKKGEGKYNQKPNYFPITVFGKSAEYCKKNLSVGSRVMVDGRLDFHAWEKDGRKNSQIKIIADNVVLLDKKKSEAHPESQPEAETSPEPESDGPKELFDDPINEPLDDPGDVPF